MGPPMGQPIEPKVTNGPLLGFKKLDCSWAYMSWNPGLTISMTWTLINK